MRDFYLEGSACHIHIRRFVRISGNVVGVFARRMCDRSNGERCRRRNRRKGKGEDDRRNVVGEHDDPRRGPAAQAAQPTAPVPKRIEVVPVL